MIIATVKFLVRGLNGANKINRLQHHYSFSTMSQTLDGLHKITDNPKNPFNLFKKWHDEVQTDNNVKKNSLCLSTSTKDGNISARNVILRRLDDDGFVIMTDNRSRKSKDLKENPRATMTFLWFKDEDQDCISRQVRIEGPVRILKDEEWQDIYEQEPLFCKIRAHICHQGAPVVWEELLENYNRLKDQNEKGLNRLEKPFNVTAYKLYPTMMEFYEAKGPQIADRLMYLKNNEWESMRIAA